MGQYLNQRDNRTELQQRLDAELRAKSAAKYKSETPDGVDDSAYIEGTKVTTTLSWAWILIGIFAAAVFIYFIYIVNQG